MDVDRENSKPFILLITECRMGKIDQKIFKGQCQNASVCPKSRWFALKLTLTTLRLFFTLRGKYAQNYVNIFCQWKKNKTSGIER